MSTDSLDHLYESLTIEKSFIRAMSPPPGGYNVSFPKWEMVRWFSDGLDEVYQNSDGEFHRLFGPAYISKKYDIEIWFKDGKYHRLDGPAIRHKKNQLWFKDGVLHRIGGPAIIDIAGPKQFWIDGKMIPPKEYKKEIQRRNRRGLIK